ncbi:recombinase family protein [Lacrimispora sp.]|uniref:recombinase family protein n=1 Tax=Lacrimispora sp. TaxID=2719234 RepID=UPI0034604FB7
MKQGDDIMINGACYVRVSTDNQLENYSIEEQTDRLKAYCKAKDINIVKFYTDGGCSGGNINRPALQQLLLDVENKSLDAVIVYKLDRLSRSQKDTLMLIEDKFLANHVDFISINENFDTLTPFGRAMIGILSVFAQLEKDQITERFTMGRIGRAKSGYFHGGGYAPTGYDYVGGNLVINEYEALQVKELYKRFANGHTVHDCWQYMSKKYAANCRTWKSETLIRNVLKNQVYIGKVKFKDVIYQGSHTPIIPEELFNEVQEIFLTSRKNMDSFKRSPFKASTLLSSLVYCGKCGAKFHGEHGNYSCYSRTKGDKRYVIDPDCKNKKWKIEELDRTVIDYIAGLNFSTLEALPPEAPRSLDYSHRIKEIEKQIEKLVDLYQVGSIPIHTITEKINALTKEKSILQDAMDNINDIKVTPEDLRAAKDRFAKLLLSGDLQEKRYCLTILIDKIIVDDEHVNIIIRQA